MQLKPVLRYSLVQRTTKSMGSRQQDKTMAAYNTELFCILERSTLGPH